MNKTLKIFSLILVLLLRAVVSYSSPLNLADNRKTEEFKPAKQSAQSLLAESVEPIQEGSAEENDEREGGGDDDLDLLFALLQYLYSCNGNVGDTGYDFYAIRGQDNLIVLYRNFRL